MSADDALIRRAEQWLDGVTDEWCDCPECAQTIIRDLLAAVRACEGWQPIATAPKDETRVLLYRGDWMESVAVGWWSRSEETWIIAGGATSVFARATHWMPLPAGPEVQP